MAKRSEKSRKEKANRVGMSPVDLKRLRSIYREIEMKSGVRPVAKVIPSRKDKDADPRKQRKHRTWERECE